MTRPGERLITSAIQARLIARGEYDQSERLRRLKEELDATTTYPSASDVWFFHGDNLTGSYRDEGLRYWEQTIKRVGVSTA